jgi:hypothetical protein
MTIPWRIEQMKGAANKVSSIQDILMKTLTGADFHVLLGDYLDEFYRSDKNIQQQMLDTQPSGDALKNPQEHLSFAASAVHKLANDHDLVVPRWVFDKIYYMFDKPFFGCKAKGNLRLLFMYKSPAEFKHRNLFVDENVLVRV